MDTTEEPDKFDQENATSVGDLLKSSRLNSGEDLKDIAGILRINYAYLKAIEEGQFDLLPGATYSLGFVRAYSEYLGLESSEVVRRLKSQESVSETRVELDFPQPIPEVSVPGGAVIFIGILISILAYGAWYINSSNDGYLSNMIASIPERFSSTVKQPEIEKSSKIILKKETSSDHQDNKNNEKKNVNLNEIKEPSQQVRVDQVKNQTEKSEFIEQPQLEIDSSKKIKSYPVPRPKSEQSMNTVAELLNDKKKSISEAAKVISNNKIESAPESELSANIKNNKTELAIASFGQNPSEISSPVLKDLESSVYKEMPSVKILQASKTKPIVDSERKPSVVPMDLIPSATPLATGNMRSEQEVTEKLPATTPQSVLKNNSSKTKSASTSNKGLFKASSSIPAARIVIRAKTTSWIQVRDDTANEILLTRLLREGDSYNVPKRNGLMLSAGNAGALDIFVDGKVVPSIGGIGDVRREVMLDADKLKAGMAGGE